MDTSKACEYPLELLQAFSQCTYSLQMHRLSPNGQIQCQRKAAPGKGWTSHLCERPGSVCLLLCKGQQHWNTEILPQALLPDGTKEERLHVNNFMKISAADWTWSNSTHKTIKHHYLFLSWSAEFSYLSSSRSSEEMPSLRSKLQILGRAVADDSTIEEHVKAYE